MAWGNYTNQSGSGERRKWYEEGNVETMAIPNEKARVRILTEDVSPEDFAKQKKIPVEQAAEELYTTEAEKRWIMPKSVWVHAVESIPGVRFFSQIACGGRGSCRLCMLNEEAVEKAGGPMENKMKPFPIRKRYLIPVWVYDLDKVLFILQNENFVNDIKAILDQFGMGCDLLVYREGAGMRTQYKVMYAGDAQLVKLPPVPITPAEVNMYPDAQEMARRLGETQANTRQTPPPETPPPAAVQPELPVPAVPPAEPKEPAPAARKPKQEPGDYVVPFGQHKGKSLEQLMAEGEKQYIQFLKDSSGGAVQDAVTAFMNSLGDDIPF